MSIVAIIVPTVIWVFDKRSRDTDARDRQQEREADRTERIAERNSVSLDVRLVFRERPNRPVGGEDYWWRLSMIGGTAFSRATVIRFEARLRASEEWQEPFDWPGPIELAASEHVYLQSMPPTFGSQHEVRVEWAPHGQPTQHLQRAVYGQPW